MINLITGKKGSGKTKKLIEQVNQALQTSKGHVVVIEQGDKLKYDVKYTARLIDTDEYRINGYDALYGFIAGLSAGNFDITDVLVDGIFRICGDDREALGEMLDKINALSGDKKYVFTISADITELPESVKKYL